MSKIVLPVAQMHGCPWNVLDASGSRIALCGGDSNRDWETFGPAIAAEIVAALTADPSSEIARLRADVERLRGLLAESSFLLNGMPAVLERVDDELIDAMRAKITAALAGTADKPNEGG